MTDIPIKIQFVKTLHNLKPSRIIVVKPDNSSEFQLFVTDKSGIPFPIKDNTGGSITITNTDGNLDITGVSNKVINLSASILATINSALQSGDNISELVNDEGYLKLIDLPDTKLEFNAQLIDGDFLFVGDVTQYTDEQAQDAVGNNLLDTTTIDLDYNDVTGQISANVQANSITANELSDTINVSEFINDAGYEANTIETLSSTNGSIAITSVGDNRDIEVVQATESQLGGGKIVTQVTIENEATTNDTEIVTAKKFWQGWTKGLTLSSFFNAVRGTVLTGLSFVSSRITSSDSILSAFGKLQRQTTELQSTRFISGNGVTINGVDNTKFDIQVVGVIVDPITFVETSINVNLTSQTVTYIASQVESYVWINNFGVVVQSLTPPNPIDLDYIVGYWVLVHSNLINLNVINSFPYYAEGLAIKVAQLLNFLGFRKFKDTNIISTGTTGTRLTHTGGNVLKAGIGNTTKRPILNLSGATDTILRMRNRNGVEGADTQNIDTTNIDIGGVTTSLSNPNRFGAHKVWKFASSLIRVQRGQYEYTNIDAAKTGIKIDAYVDEGNCARNGIHIGWIIFKRGTSWGTGGTGTNGIDYLFIDEIQSASAGTSAVTMQGTYDNSSQPQLTTNTIKGAVQFQGGTGVDTDHIFEGKSNAGVITSWIAANGTSSFGGTSPKYATLLSSQLTEQNIKGFVDYANALSPNLVISANEVYDFVATDTGMIFKLYKAGVTIGLGQTAITAADVSVNKSYWNNEFLNTYKVVSRGDATLTVLGTGAFAATGTAAGIAGGTGLYAEIRQKTGITSTTSTAGSTCGYRDASQTFFNFSQGFKASFMFANSDAALVADARNFVGFTNSNSVIGNVNPSTLLSIFGLANDSGEANFSIMHNDGSGTATKIPLGVNFPANTSKTDVYKVTFETFPNTNRLYWEVKRLNTGHIASGVITTDVNFSSAGFAPHFWHNSGATALAVNQTFFSFISNFYY